MPSYFKPLRRKIGVLMLAVACAFTVGWVRSGMIIDLLQMDRIAIVSLDSRIMVDSSTDERFIFPVWQTEDAIDFDEMFSDVPWTFRALGFAHVREEDGTSSWFIPYWSIVVPLILLAVWLLFCKPRAKQIEPKSATDFFR